MLIRYRCAKYECCATIIHGVTTNSIDDKWAHMNFDLYIDVIC